MGSRILQRFLRITPQVINSQCRFLTTKPHSLSFHRYNHIKKTYCKRMTAQQEYRTAAAPHFQYMNIQDSQDFQQRVLASEVPVIVDFHATWCGPCKLLGPRLQAVVANKGGKVLLAKINIDENTELAMEYGVQSVPSVYGMKNGKVKDTFIGLIDDDKIDTFVENLIN